MKRFVENEKMNEKRNVYHSQKKKKYFYSLDEVFNPKSIVLIGVPPNPNTVGYRMLKGMVDFGYSGRIQIVDVHKQEVLGFYPYSRVTEISYDIDLAIVMVPAKIVPLIVKDSVEKNVKGIVIISSGFSETGETGRILEEELVKLIHGTRTRIVGPNCLGIYCPSSRITFNSSFSKESGSVACISQSGGIGSHFARFIIDRGLGISKLVSVGNKCDLQINDYIEYFSEDPETEVISCYVEELKDARRFIEIAGDIARKKPVVIWKGGRSKTGTRVVKSHTGSIAGSTDLYTAAFKQTGVIEANGLGELTDFVLTFQCLQPRNIKNIGVISGPAGINVAIVDVFEKLGFNFPVFSQETKEELKNLLPWFAAISNPTDLTMGTTATRGHVQSRFELLKNMLRVVAKDEEIDLVVTGSGDVTIDYAKVLIEASKKSEKPIIVICFPRMNWNVKGIKLLGKAGIPVYLNPQGAAKSIKALTSRSKFLSLY